MDLPDFLEKRVDGIGSYLNRGTDPFESFPIHRMALFKFIRVEQCHCHSQRILLLATSGMDGSITIRDACQSG